MYLSLNTILLLGAALVAAVPTPTPDAIQSQGLDVSGSSSHPAPDALAVGVHDEKVPEDATHIVEIIFNNQTTTAAAQSKCKWGCFKKYGPILGLGCMKKCKD